jgi:hypothetical protein
MLINARAPFCGGACGRSHLCPWYEWSLIDQDYGDCVGLWWGGRSGSVANMNGGCAMQGRLPATPSGVDIEPYCEAWGALGLDRSRRAVGARTKTAAGTVKNFVYGLG